MYLNAKIVSQVLTDYLNRYPDAHEGMNPEGVSMVYMQKMFANELHPHSLFNEFVDAYRALLDRASTELDALDLPEDASPWLSEQGKFLPEILSAVETKLPTLAFLLQFGSNFNRSDTIVDYYLDGCSLLKGSDGKWLYMRDHPDETGLINHPIYPRLINWSAVYLLDIPHLENLVLETFMLGTLIPHPKSIMIMTALDKVGRHSSGDDLENPDPDKDFDMLCEEYNQRKEIILGLIAHSRIV